MDIGFRGRPPRAWVIGSGLDVWEVIELLRSYDGDEEALRENHPLITDRHLRVAQAYAGRFPTEIEALIKKNHPPLDELRVRLASIAAVGLRPSAAN
jgi:hypothetical protein